MVVQFAALLRSPASLRGHHICDAGGAVTDDESTSPELALRLELIKRVLGARMDGRNVSGFFSAAMNLAEHEAMDAVVQALQEKMH